MNNKLKLIILISSLMIVVDFVNADVLYRGDRAYFTCNNATSGQPLGSAANIDCFDRAGNNDVADAALTQAGTGLFYYTFTVDVDRYMCQIACPTGAVINYTVPITIIDNLAVGSNFTQGITTLADNAITANKIATDAITAAKIAADAIGASEIAANAIGASELATDAVTEITTGLATTTNVIDTAVNLNNSLRSFIAVDSVNLNTSLRGYLATASALATAQADLDNPNQYKADVSALPTLTQLQNKVDDLNTSLRSYLATQTSVNALPTNQSIANTLLSSAITTTAGTVGYNLSKIAAPSGSALTAGEIADAVWDEDLSTHLSAGSTGYNLSKIAVASGSALTAADIWTYSARNVNSTNFQNDKTGYSLSASQSFSTSGTVATCTAVTNGVTVTTNNDKTGYTVSTVQDKTGYSLTTQNWVTDCPTNASVYNYFTAGSNEDQFKADITTLATTANLVSNIVNLNTSLRSYITSDSVNLNTSLRSYLATASALATAQADLDNPNQYKADVSSLATPATVWAYVGGRTLTALDDDVTVIDLDDTKVGECSNVPTNQSIVNTLLSSAITTTAGTVGYNISKIGTASITGGTTITSSDITAIADRVHTYDIRGNVSTAYIGTPAYYLYKVFTRP